MYQIVPGPWWPMPPRKFRKNETVISKIMLLQVIKPPSIAILKYVEISFFLDIAWPAIHQNLQNNAIIYIYIIYIYYIYTYYIYIMYVHIYIMYVSIYIYILVGNYRIWYAVPARSSHVHPGVIPWILLLREFLRFLHQSWILCRSLTYQTMSSNHVIGKLNKLNS